MAGDDDSTGGKGRGISFGNENETVDFDHQKTVAELAPKRMFRKTGANVEEALESMDLDSPESPSKTVPGGDPKEIQKKYKAGISFSNYSMDDEPDEEDMENGTPPPSDKLLDASPSYLAFRRSVASQHKSLEDRLSILEKGGGGDWGMNTGANTSYVAGFMTGGNGATLDGWSGLAILVHLLMIVGTLLVLVDGITVDEWMVFFLIFLVVTLAKYMTTFNKVRAGGSRAGGDSDKSANARVVIDVEKGA